MDGDLPLALDAEVLPPGALADEEFLAQAEGQIRGYGKLVVSGIVEIGRKLVEVKEHLPGRYIEFVEDRLHWSKMQATRFVNSYELLKGNNLLPHAADLTIDASSLYLIAAPSTPAEVRAFVVSRSERRNVTKGEHAMAIALAYPDGGGGGPGRSDPAATAIENIGVSQIRVRQARQVLRHSMEIALAVRDGVTKLDKALEEVRQAQAELTSGEGGLVFN